MAITIEDGSQVSGGNSYNAVADLRAYASARGRTLPVSDDDCEVLLVNSFDYLETLRDQYKGDKTSLTQPSQWPRVNVFIDAATEPEDAFPSDEIPIELKKAQCELCCIDASGTSPYPQTSVGPFVTMEKLDVLETHYSEKFGTSISPSIPTVDALLQPLLNDGSFTLRTIRV